MADHVHQQAVDRAAATVTAPLTALGITTITKLPFRVDDAKVPYNTLWIPTSTLVTLKGEIGRRVQKRTFDLVFRLVTKPKDDDPKYVVAGLLAIEQAMGTNLLLRNDAGEPLLDKGIELSDTQTTYTGQGANTYVNCTISYTGDLSTRENDPTVSLAQEGWRLRNP